MRLLPTGSHDNTGFSGTKLGSVAPLDLIFMEPMNLMVSMGPMEPSGPMETVDLMKPVGSFEKQGPRKPLSSIGPFNHVTDTIGPIGR